MHLIRLVLAISDPRESGFPNWPRQGCHSFLGDPGFPRTPGHPVVPYCCFLTNPPCLMVKSCVSCEKKTACRHHLAPNQWLHKSHIVKLSENGATLVHHPCFFLIFHKINHPAIWVLPLVGPRCQSQLLRRWSHPISSGKKLEGKNGKMLVFYSIYPLT